MQNGHKTTDEVKYEALAQLIAQSQEEQRQKWNDFKENFTEFKTNLKEDMNELKAYNKKQNGNIAEALNRIGTLEEKELTHIINCPMVEKVRVLEDESLTTTSIKRWVTKTVAITAGALSAMWIIFQIIIRIFDVAPK